MIATIQPDDPKGAVDAEPGRSATVAEQSSNIKTPSLISARLCASGFNTISQ